MIDNQKLFGNFFDTKEITPLRFYGFSNDAYNALVNGNSSGQYDGILAILKPLIPALGSELGVLDTSLNVQKGATLTNDQVLSNFAFTMSDEEPFIARALGGRATAAYLQFYPHQISEYSQATKTQMPTLTQRIFTAAGANSIALGTTLTTLLQGFQQQWADSRDDQETDKSQVKGTRTVRSSTLLAAQLGMLTAIHTVAALNPGDVATCSSFFNFNLLFTHTVHKHQLLAGTPAAGATEQVLNQTHPDRIAWR
jgi:hypothetical protein